MRALLLVVAVSVLSTLVGCAGVTKTPAEIGYTMRQAADMDARQLTDDWNTIWLADRQYRLSRWYTR